MQERQKLEAEAALSISNEETVSQAVQKNKKKTNEMLKALHAEEVCSSNRIGVVSFKVVPSIENLWLSYMITVLNDYCICDDV